MAFQDFRAHFDKVEVCNLSPDALQEDALHRWEVAVHQGSWVRGSTAGGCRNFLGAWPLCHSLFHFQESSPSWGHQRARAGPQRKLEVGSWSAGPQGDLDMRAW